MGRIILIAACAQGGAIGRNNALPWRCPEDLKRFRELTTGRVCLMGRKTADSLGKPLKDRVNLVLTADPSWSERSHHEFVRVDSLDEVGEVTKDHDLWVIGGQTLYEHFLPLADVVHLTIIDQHVPGADAFFPVKELRGFSDVHVGYSADPKITYWTFQR